MLKQTGGGVTTNLVATVPEASPASYTATLPDGTVQMQQIGLDGSDQVTSADGSTWSAVYSPDPRFGMQAPLSTQTRTTPGGLVNVSSTTKTVTLATANDPFSTALEIDTQTINGQTWTTTYCGPSATNCTPNTTTTTSPMGRTTTTTRDAYAEPVTTSVPNMAASTTAYDSHGRLSSSTQGTFVQNGTSFPQTYMYGYDAHGYPSSTTDPMGNVTSLLNTLAGRSTHTMTPDGYGGTRDLVATYDGDGNLASLTLPKGEVHDMTYTAADALASYAPPSLGAGTWTTGYDYTTDGLAAHEYRPDGTTVTYAYDSAGRLSTTTAPVGSVVRGYDATTGHLTSLSANWLDSVNEALSFGYDGFLETRMTWSGTVAGTVGFGYDDNFRVTSRTVAGASASFGYDDDGLLTNAAGMTITRDPSNGRITGSTLGGVTDTYGYDANGLLASYVASFGNALLYSETIETRDGLGRITQKTDRYAMNEVHVWTYAYDAAGRLTDATEDGALSGHYDYDADDNRTKRTAADGTVTVGSYDAQDRLTAYGGTTYTYGANGELQTKTDAGGTTEYTYDSFGDLRNVTPPTGSAVDYVIDGLNRRVGRKVGGTLVQGLLYQNQLNVVAELDGSGNLVAQYVYGTKGNVPDVKTDGTGTYRILSDHLGSPRLVVNTANGTVAERMDFDEWGNVTADTAPSTTPFGFTGGLYEAPTGLVRLGARDYESATGRWVSKDRLRFAGGQSNIYVYAGDDPIDEVDPTGLDANSPSQCTPPDTIQCCPDGVKSSEDNPCTDCSSMLKRVTCICYGNGGPMKAKDCATCGTTSYCGSPDKVKACIE